MHLYLPVLYLYCACIYLYLVQVNKKLMHWMMKDTCDHNCIYLYLDLYFTCISHLYFTFIYLYFTCISHLYFTFIYLYFTCIFHLYFTFIYTCILPVFFTCIYLYLHLYCACIYLYLTQVNEKLTHRMMKDTCDHDYYVRMLPVVVEGKSRLCVTCPGCEDVKLFSLHSGGCLQAFHDRKLTPYRMCHGKEGRVFMHSYR